MKVALIPCASTEWAQHGRLLGRVELEPTAEAPAQCAAWSEQLRPANLGRIFFAPDELSKSTARHLARALNIPVKELDDLEEVDLGLWAGLTEEDLKKRYATAHRQLVDSPLKVSPPRGEVFAAAADRLRECFKKRLKPNAKEAIGLVMRPFCFAMARYLLEGEGVKIWETSRSPNAPIVMELFAMPKPEAEGSGADDGKETKHD